LVNVSGIQGLGHAFTNAFEGGAAEGGE